MPKTVAAFGGTEALQAFNSRAHDPLTPYFAATFAAFIPRPVLPGLSEKRFSCGFLPEAARDQLSEPGGRGLRRSRLGRDDADEHHRDRDGEAAGPACDHTGAYRCLAERPAPPPPVPPPGCFVARRHCRERARHAGLRPDVGPLGLAPQAHQPDHRRRGPAAVPLLNHAQRLRLRDRDLHPPGNDITEEAPFPGSATRPHAPPRRFQPRPSFAPTWMSVPRRSGVRSARARRHRRRGTRCRACPAPAMVGVVPSADRAPHSPPPKLPGGPWAIAPWAGIGRPCTTRRSRGRCGARPRRPRSRRRHDASWT